MIEAFASSLNGLLDKETIFDVLAGGLAGKLSGQKCLVLIPDHTRTLPLPDLFRMLVRVLDDAAQLDFMVALGTHPALSENQLNRLVGITAEERETTFRHVGILNHEWMNPDALTSFGVIGRDEVRAISGEYWHESLPDEVDVTINKAIKDYDQVIILGPTFPHEVAGFSGGAKYLFPGISGPEIINATHWLGALATVLNTIGIKQTPVRDMIHAAARRLPVNVTLIALVVVGHDLSDIYIGDLFEAWGAAADASAKRHIRWVEKPYQRVLAKAPEMYDELWTAAKATYKVEAAVENGGEVVIYAPHLDTVSVVHGKYIYEAGYHVLPYFLENWEKYRHIPLGVLAHCTHLRGSGRMVGGIEKPNIKVTLASKLSAVDCERLNLGYLDPQKIDVGEWKGREDEGVLFIPKAGEILFKVKEPV